MDRPIQVAEKRKKRLTWFLGVAFGLMALIFGSNMILRAMRPNLKRSELMISVVEEGPVNAVIETSGLLVPQREQVLASPGETRVIRVLRKPGSFVNEGDPILELDMSAFELEIGRLNQQLGVQENAKDKAVLQYEKQQKQHQSKLELIVLDLAYFEAQHKQNTQLFDHGLVSREALQQTQLQFEKKQVEKRQLEDEVRDARSTYQIEIRGFQLEIDLLQKSLKSAQERLNRATTRAPKEGVLTWVLENEGATVRQGDPLARIADLSNLKVSATISDYYANRLSVSQEALIKIGDAEVLGQISRLLPEVNNGILTFEIQLQQQQGVPVRPNQRVNVFLITDKRADVKRIRRSAALSSPGQREIFILRDNKAIKTQVVMGVTGSKYTEIISGVALGDQVILNQLDDLGHLSSIAIH